MGEDYHGWRNTRWECGGVGVWAGGMKGGGVLTWGGSWYMRRAVAQDAMKSAWRLSRVPGCGRGGGAAHEQGYCSRNPPTVKARFAGRLGRVFLLGGGGGYGNPPYCY